MQCYSLSSRASFSIYQSSLSPCYAGSFCAQSFISHDINVRFKLMSIWTLEKRPNGGVFDPYSSEKY